MQRPPWNAIGLLSGAALAYELLLIRLLSQVHWASLVGLVISLALLGYGASGTLLSLLGERWRDRYGPLFVINALLFAMGSVLCFQLAQRLPLNPLATAWDLRQLGWFATLYLLLALPFLAVANAIGLSFWRFPQRINRIYASDLVGAALGVAAAVGLLFVMTPSDALRLVALAGVAGALLARRLLLPSQQRMLFGGAVILSVALLLAPAAWFKASAADYKALSQALAVTGAGPEPPLVNPLGVITTVASPAVPYRHAPGLSLVSPLAPPASEALFIDGDPLGVRYDPGLPKEHLDYLLSAAAYHLLRRPRVLLAGAHDGAALAQAELGAASGIEVVEPNPLLAASLGRTGENVILHPVSWRRFLRQTDEHYDLLQLSIGEAIGSVAGLQAQQEQYRYTVEAFADALRRLTPGGLLSVTRGLQLPPRASLRVTATAIAALDRIGVGEPAAHLAILRSWNAVTLLVSASPFTTEALQTLRDFARQRAFDLVYLPGMAATEANHFNRLDSPDLYLGVSALLSDVAARFIADYPFAIEPATDDRPYFERFTRLGSLGSLLKRTGRTGLAQIDWGYFLALTALLLALLSSLLLILAPLGLLRRNGTTEAGRGRATLYFAAIGLAFLFVEIAFIQRLQLFLGVPIYAAAVVIGGFLLAAGVGSGLSRRLGEVLGIRRTLQGAVVLILLTALGYLGLLPMLFDSLVGWDTPGRVLLCLLLVTPLGLVMGMPFPLGLVHFGGQSERLIPWAWGVNGCASVISALLAPLLAMEIGFSGLIVSATVLYIIAALLPLSRQAGTYT